SASSQSAFATRTHVAVSLERPSKSGARTGLAAWFLLSDFRLRENFTGYTKRSQIMPQWVGRGDLTEQINHDLGLGARFFQRSRRLVPVEWLSGNFELGVAFRSDILSQAQNLLEEPNNETWDRRVDASIHGSDIGVYGDTDWRITRYAHLRGGFRADVLYYD